MARLQGAPLAHTILALALLAADAARAQSPPVAYRRISAGVFVTCAISDAGLLYCWGNNDDGAVGDSTQETRLAPVRAASTDAWKDVSAGDWHACGTTIDLKGACWGFNGGRLGIGREDPVQATTPQFLDGAWNEVSAGHFHGCGIKADSTAWCWGNNKNGRMGNGTVSEASGGGHETEVMEYTPRLVKGGDGWATISAKGSHTCGLKTDGSAYCWGGNEDGELGIGTQGADAYETTPKQVKGTWKAITSGLRYSCGINMEDDLYCWGSLRGGASNDTAEAIGPKPKLAGAPGMKWKTISGGMQHACGLLQDDTARCFGLGWHGQLGQGQVNGWSAPCASTAPCEPAGGRTWRDVSAGEYNSCGVDAAGAAFCWGENPYGQQGNGEVGGNVYEPLAVLPAVDSLLPGAAPAPAPALLPLAPALAPVMAPVMAPMTAPAAAPVVEAAVAAFAPAAAPAASGAAAPAVAAAAALALAFAAL